MLPWFYFDLTISGSINPESYRNEDEDDGEANTDGIDLGSQRTTKKEPAISRTVTMTTTTRSARREARREAGCNIQS